MMPFPMPIFIPIFTDINKTNSNIDFIYIKNNIFIIAISIYLIMIIILVTILFITCIELKNYDNNHCFKPYLRNKRNSLIFIIIIISIFIIITRIIFKNI